MEPDSVLIPGDIVQDKIVPNMPNADASVKNWLAILDQLEPLHPRFVVPDHGALGDGSLIAKERAFLLDLQTRSLELKRQGKSADEAATMVTAEFKNEVSGLADHGPGGQRGEARLRGKSVSLRNGNPIVPVTVRGLT